MDVGDRALPRTSTRAQAADASSCTWPRSRPRALQLIDQAIRRPALVQSGESPSVMGEYLLEEGRCISGCGDKGVDPDGKLKGASCVEMVRAIRQAHPDIPIGLLLGYKLLFTRGDSAYRDRQPVQSRDREASERHHRTHRLRGRLHPRRASRADATGFHHHRLSDGGCFPDATHSPDQMAGAWRRVGSVVRLHARCGRAYRAAGTCTIPLKSTGTTMVCTLPALTPSAIMKFAWAFM